ncbi:hypothetical protein Tco_1398257, partial [Tanacetum coccineum]
IMEIEPDIENMTLNEYLKYAAEKERRLSRNLRSKRSPIKYEEADFDSFNQDKMSSYTSDEVDIDSMTIEEYELYIAKQEGAKVDECDEGDMYDIWDITVKDVERLKQLLTPSVYTMPEPDLVVQPSVPLLSSPNKVKVVRDEEPNNDSQNISIQVPDVMDDVMQPLIPHITPPDKDYLASVTKSILDELLEKFGDDILNIDVVDEEADCNPTKDIEALERLHAKDPQS